MKKLVYLLGIGILLSGCSNGALEPAAPATVDPVETESTPTLTEDPNGSVPQFSIEGAITECYAEDGIVTLFVRNTGNDKFYYNSKDAENSTPVIETVLRNENGRGFADYAWHLTPEEGIDAGASGELYAYFAGLLIGFDGRFNQVEVTIDGVKVYEQDISLSQSDCG